MTCPEDVGVDEKQKRSPSVDVAAVCTFAPLPAARPVTVRRSDGADWLEPPSAVEGQDMVEGSGGAG